MILIRNLKPNNYINMRDRIIVGLRNNKFRTYGNNSILLCMVAKKFASMTATLRKGINMIRYKITDRHKQIIHDAQMGCIGGIVTGYIILKYSD